MVGSQLNFKYFWTARVKVLSTSSRCSSLRLTVQISNLTSLSEKKKTHFKKKKEKKEKIFAGVRLEHARSH